MKRDVYQNKKKFWEDTIQKQRESGRSVEDWCRIYQLPITRFLVWEKRLSIEPSKTIGTVFEPIRLRDTTKQITVTINDNTITCDKETLSQIVALLK